MTGALIEAFIQVDLTLKALEDGASITVKLTNLPKTSDAPSTFYYPIIKKIGEIGVGVGNFMPETFSGSITIDNSINSFGLERKFSDLLERYTFVNQSVSIYIAQAAEGDAVTASRTLEWVAVCQNGRSIGDDFVINIAGRGIEDRVFTCVVDNSETTFSEASISALGQAIPLVLGESVEVKPVVIKDPDSDFIDYAYQTTLGTQFKGGDISAYYARASANSDYGRVYGAASTSTKLYDALTGTLITVATGNDEAHRTRDITPTGTDAYILTHAEVTFLTGTAGATGSFSLEIWAKDRNGYPFQMVGQAVREKSDYTWGAGNVAVYFVFPNPIPLVAENGYVAYITQSSSTANDIHPAYISGASTKTSYTKAKVAGVTTNQAWLKHTFNQRDFASAFYGLTLTTSDPGAGDITANGLSYQKLTAYHRTGGSWAGLTDSDLSSLDLVVITDGLKDDSSGNITGTPSQVLSSPAHIAELLNWNWNGSAWAAGKFSDSLHSTTHVNVNSTASPNYREISGRTTGLTGRLQTLEEICRHSACKITMSPSATTPIGLWAWGTKAEAVYTIGDDDLEVIGFDMLGAETVINTVEMYYNETLRPLTTFTGNTQGQFRAYQSRLYWTYATNAETAAISTGSYTCFGERKNKDTSYKWLHDDQSAEFIARFLIKHYREPHNYVDLYIPYWKYKAIKIMDVLNIVSTKLPAFFGTSPDATLPSYGGEASVYSDGFQFMRANLYRAQVEARRVVFDESGAPRLKLSLRLLTGKYDQV